MLRLIGLGVRARTVVVGVEQVRTAAKKGTLVFAVVAPDASANSREKVVPLLRARGVNFVEGPTAAELGAAVGRVQTAAVGVVDPQLARGIRALVKASVGSDS
ncbi:MAG TPA: ribosomal L7Ae/L30e/S12e/Gadd45 family protein [Gemmatimonadaceae bacterium]|nr:ribosomal L7Ae/L30e/S12e/Gadd45 family protein [Gemmatimonadaceae bacterium]